MKKLYSQFLNDYCKTIEDRIFEMQNSPQKQRAIDILWTFWFDHKAPQIFNKITKKTMTKETQKTLKQNHFCIFCVVLETDGWHIIPHPTSKEEKKIIIPLLKEILKRLR